MSAPLRKYKKAMGGWEEKKGNGGAADTASWRQRGKARRREEVGKLDSPQFS